MASTLTIPLTTLPVGELDLGPANAADAETGIVLTIDRTVAGGLNSLTPASTVAVNVFQSNDGGVTWMQLVGATMPGGVVGLGHATSDVRTGLFPGTSRKLKATVIVAGTPVAVAGTLVSA